MKIKLGIIGLGNIIEKHIQAIEEISEFEIKYVCDKNPEKLKSVMQKLNCKGYADYDKLLMEKPDVVLITLPHGLHCKVTIDAIKAGCHVMVEKPMAINVEECNKMLSAAKEYKKHIIVTDLASFYPGVLKTAQEFRSGFLGRFFTGCIMNIRYYFNNDRPSWFLDPEMSGGGMFFNIGIHRLAIARGCLPGLNPISVSASVSYLPKYKIEACTSAIVKYKEGGSMIYEEVGYYPKPDWINSVTHFIFERGIVAWDEHLWKMMDTNGNEKVEVLKYKENPYIDTYYNLLKAIKGEYYYPTAYEYAMDIAVAQAVYASSAQGREICLKSAEFTIKNDL